MLPAIKFNNQSCFERHKIKYVIAKWMLTAKLHTELLTSQELP